MKLLRALVVTSWAMSWAMSVSAAAMNRYRIIEHPDPAKRAELQDIVTWDSKSLFINGERIMIFSGEFHPFRLPVPSLWLDVFQKIKSLGMNTVSFYVDWALLEGKPGDYSAEGVLSLEPFFDAAKQAGIYLIARPGPYINAEASGGGFPGWLQRLNATLRTKEPGYLNATNIYVSNTAKSIAGAQITSGGPVILYQPENEYTWSANGQTVPDGEYMQYVIDQARKAGIVVPMISNDAAANGDDAPGSGTGAVDIYGHDAYFFGPTDCETPSIWPPNEFPTTYRTTHDQQSPSTPYTLMEFQGGCWLPWGGTVYDNCASLMNSDYERVYYKNDFSFGVAIFNLYMTAGGTNWGNLGYPQGYTSYDYAAAVKEDRTVTREKLSELKTIANFMKVSPAYLDALPANASTGIYTDTSDLTVTPLIGSTTPSSFYIVRQDDTTSTSSTTYTLKLNTTMGNVTVPQLGGTLSINGRDSKVHVTDYNISTANVIYSTAEIFTWKSFEDRTVLVVYGGPGEKHEMQIQVPGDNISPSVVEGSSSSVTTKTTSTSVLLNWSVEPQRMIVQVGHVDIYLLDRNAVYNYWVPELSPSDGPGFGSWANTMKSIIVNGGYLIRTSYLQGDQLHITADFNATTSLEVIGAPKSAKSLIVNGRTIAHKTDANGIWSASIEYQVSDLNLPDLTKADWKYIDSLPEIQDNYDDSAWPDANLAQTYNNQYPLSTPTSLYGSDYGFNTGYLIYRGRFTANGKETTLNIHTQGGSAFGSSVCINSTSIGMWNGDPNDADNNANYSIPQLESGKEYVFTVIVDQNGFEENGAVGSDSMKAPRGVLDYSLDGHDASDISWKITGNLGGEDYADRVRGPLNEGGLYAERQGWHQPSPPVDNWEDKAITEGLPGTGVGFFSAKFALDIPSGVDVPLAFTFANTTQPPSAYRAQLYVNGYQFGKYINAMGPQVEFPVPEGILNYRGDNWVAVSVWSQDTGGAKVDGLQLTAGTPVMTTYGPVALVDMPSWKQRDGAY